MNKIIINTQILLAFICDRLTNKASLTFLTIISLLMLTCSIYLTTSFAPIWDLVPNVVSEWLEIGFENNFSAYFTLIAFTSFIYLYIKFLKKTAVKLTIYTIKKAVSTYA